MCMMCTSLAGLSVEDVVPKRVAMLKGIYLNTLDPATRSIRSLHSRQVLFACSRDSNPTYSNVAYRPVRPLQ